MASGTANASVPAPTIGSFAATTWPNGWTTETFKTGNADQATLVSGDPSIVAGATGADPSFTGYYIRIATPADIPDAAPISWETFAADGIRTDIVGKPTTSGAKSFSIDAIDAQGEYDR